MLPIAKAQVRSYWQQQVNYHIDVTLNDEDNTLNGYEKLDYYNNSPDTLNFIWFHCWPNAYKNDKTAFSDQFLENGNTAFYFSNNNERGYINRLDFRVDNETSKTEDHPKHQDIIKLILPHPLFPGHTCKIETPFHVKLPSIFSRSGYTGQSYQVTQWFPKPAVYDKKGWHPIPYLSQGEFYSEFGNFEVQITTPQNYIVAATGELQEKDEKDWLLNRAVKNNSSLNDSKEASLSSRKIKTIHFKQENVHDFAWFANKDFSVKHDTIQLKSGRIIDAFAFYKAAKADAWANSMLFIKRTIRSRSQWLGEYPYSTVKVVESQAPGNNGGMEYPTIALVSNPGDEKMLDLVISHEISHNWLYGILGTNERTHPWMDEGINTFYDNRYLQDNYGSTNLDLLETKSPFFKRKLPENIVQTFLQTQIGLKKDQPIETESASFSALNYELISYFKTANWMQWLEGQLGRSLFDSSMKEYYRQWQFKHPYPEDLKKVMEEVSGRSLDTAFSLLTKKGAIEKPAIKKDIRFSFLFNLKQTDKHQYFCAAPAFGFNKYDKLMIGLVLHNYTLPLPKLQFVLVPLYATNTRQLNGTGRIGYSWFPGNDGQKATLSIAASSFSKDQFTDTTGKQVVLRFAKIVPSFKFVFANKDPRSTITKYIQWKTYFIREQQLLFTRDPIQQIDIITRPTFPRYLNQLQFVIENGRVLYPFKAALQVEQGDGFIRPNFTGNYYFNYAKGGGMNVRFFAGKFIYIGDKTLTKQFATDQYHMNMTGPKGYEDYTYGNYFVGRNEFDKLASQQIMIRDGAFKVRTDLLSNKIGKTDDWLTAINFTTDIPREINILRILPIKIPVKAFFDIGTYADVWKRDASKGKFLYDAGLQLCLIKNILNIYFPILYSKEYRDYFKSTIPDNRFIKNIAFSIDVQNIKLKTFFPQIPF